MTMIRSSSELPTAYGTLRHGFIVPVRIVCLWSALGLAVSGLLFVTGFSAEIAQTLMVAG